jgi:hypothetical protein
MFVIISFNKRKLGIPLIQIEPIVKDKKTREAIGDWHYWVNQGYIL